MESHAKAYHSFYASFSNEWLFWTDERSLRVVSLKLSSPLAHNRKALTSDSTTDDASATIHR